MSRSNIVTIFVINVHGFNDYFAAAVRGAARITTIRGAARITTIRGAIRIAATARIITTRITGIIVLLRSLPLSLSCFFLSLSLIFSLGLIYIINTSLITTDLFIDLINELLRILFGIFKNKLLVVFIRNIIKKAIEAINMLLERVSIFSRIYIKVNMVS